MSIGPGKHRGASQLDVEALRAYQATSSRALLAQVAIVLVVVLVMVIWLGSYGVFFAPLLGLPLGRYLRGRRLAHGEQAADR